MNPIEFKGQNVILGKDQPEYKNIPALRFAGGEIITCWELADEDILEIVRHKRIYVSQLTFRAPLQPLKVMTCLSDGTNPIKE